MNTTILRDLLRLCEIAKRCNEEDKKIIESIEIWLNSPFCELKLEDKNEAVPSVQEITD